VPININISSAFRQQSAVMFRVNLRLHRSQVKVKVTLRSTVSRPVSLGVRRPSGTRDQFFFLFELFFRQFRVCHFVAPSLTRGRVCNLLLLLALASAVNCSHVSRQPYGTRLYNGNLVFSVRYKYSASEYFQTNLRHISEPSARGYNWATLFLGDINTGT
jgi:hypothetical protein